MVSKARAARSGLGSRTFMRRSLTDSIARTQPGVKHNLYKRAGLQGASSRGRAMKEPGVSANILMWSEGFLPRSDWSGRETYNPCAGDSSMCKPVANFRLVRGGFLPASKNPRPRESVNRFISYLAPSRSLGLEGSYNHKAQGVTSDPDNSPP